MTPDEFKSRLEKELLRLRATYARVWLRAAEVEQPFGGAATMTLDFGAQGQSDAQVCSQPTEGVTQTNLAPDTDRVEIGLEHGLPQDTEADLVQIAWHVGAPDLLRNVYNSDGPVHTRKGKRDLQAVRWIFKPLLGTREADPVNRKNWLRQSPGADPETGTRQMECPQSVVDGTQTWDKAAPGKVTRMEFHFAGAWLQARFESLVNASGLSYRALAKKLDVGKSYIGDRMSGRRDVRRLDVLALEQLLEKRN